MDIVKQLKAISDKNRLKILEFISCNEMCACDILDHFKITQPTLSHHMKVLVDCNLVISTKKETKTFYKLNRDNTNQLISSIREIFNKDLEQCNCSTK